MCGIPCDDAVSCYTEQVTVGEEGFFGPNDSNKGCNPGEPGSSWATQSGQDFTNNHRSKDIDFAVRARCTLPFLQLFHICILVAVQPCLVVLIHGSEVTSITLLHGAAQPAIFSAGNCSVC